MDFLATSHVSGTVTCLRLRTDTRQCNCAVFKLSVVVTVLVRQHRRTTDGARKLIPQVVQTVPSLASLCAAGPTRI